jgi:aspartate aminotransferase, mitochondrial
MTTAANGYIQAPYASHIVYRYLARLHKKNKRQKGGDLGFLSSLSSGRPDTTRFPSHEHDSRNHNMSLEQGTERETPSACPTSAGNKVGHIRRASLQLHPSWDKERDASRHLGDLDDDDVIKIAFFPLDQLPKTPQEEKNTVIELAEAVEDEEGDEWSTATITDSVYSYNTVSGIWNEVPMGPPDPILGIAQAFRQCEDPRKVNVCVGAYRDDTGKPYVLPSVRAAEKKLWEDMEIKEYLPIEGDKDFLMCSMKFAYGKGMDIENHVAAVQTLSGTGACAIGGHFLKQFWADRSIYIPDPSWGNHVAIFKQCGLEVRKYRYYDRRNNKLDLEGMIQDLSRAQDGSIILLHACAHNPTGCDPSLEEWKELISVISNKGHIAFFDAAYLGFASGDAESDAQPFRYAVSQHVPVLLAQSFAKNFGLYGERVGALSVVCGSSTQKERILSELRCIIRPMYSSPPRHGSSIVKTVLTDPKLTEEYYQECAGMAVRIKKMRVKLVQALLAAGSVHDWSHITKQIGMFAFTGMSEAMCKRLTSEFSIFLTTNGRISMAGLNDSNLDYVAKAILAVTEGQSIGG